MTGLKIISAQTVFNLSNRVLSEFEKGMDFAPELSKNVNRFCRRMRIK